MSLFLSNKKGFTILLVTCVLVGGVVSAYSRPQNRTIPASTGSAQKTQVVATIYPLADFATQVGGDLVDVVTIVPAGAEPHDYEPTPQDVVKMYQADVVLINGNGFDAWAEKLIPALRAEDVRVVLMSEEIEPLPLEDEAGFDPHAWLDPVFAMRVSEAIARAISSDVSDVGALGAQKSAYIARLRTLDDAYRTGLAQCEQRDIVTSHDAFRYPAKRYNLTNYAIAGLSPEEDPSARDIAEVSRLVKEKGVTTIFFETLVSPKLAETIASEAGVGTAILNPIEGLTEEEVAAGKDYVKIMEENLKALRTALTCS